MNKKQALANKKLMLLVEVEQQRLSMVHTTQEWVRFTAPIDHYFQTFMRMRKGMLLGAGIMALFALRKPARAIKISRTAIKAWGATRLVQRLLNR